MYQGWRRSVIFARARGFKSRMKDDDGEIYYYRLADSCDDEKAFAPLDSFGMPNAGCTSAEYYNSERKVWEVL